MESRYRRRRPAWWPRELKVVPSPRRRRPPSPTTVAAAESRLREIRVKLEAGERLSTEEESDATAILQLKDIWAESAVPAAGLKEAPLAPLIGHLGLALPQIPRHGRDIGLEAAEALTGGFR